MESAPLPPDEEQRLSSLQNLRIMGTAAEAAWDHLAEMASKLCKTPISLVSLVGEKRQWFKARVGLEAQETPREYAFCAYALLEEDPFVVPDTDRDARFLDNPLVTGDPNIRFYAGAPIRAPDGAKLGTICVIDREPRELDDFQMDGLKVIAEMAEALLTMRAAAIVMEDAIQSLQGDGEGPSPFIESIQTVTTQLDELAADVDVPTDLQEAMETLKGHAKRIVNACQDLGSLTGD